MKEYCLVPLHGKLGKGLSAKVSPQDYELVNNIRWLGSSSGSSGAYAVHQSRENGVCKYLLMHRFILSATPKQSVDHKNHDTLDNTRDNIRICTNAENNRNRKGKSGSQSIYKGVGVSCGKYKSVVGLNKKLIHLGTYQTETEAALAYDIFAHENFGDFAYLNFPEIPYQEKKANPPIKWKPSSQYKGVFWSKAHEKWRAQLKIDHKSVHVGLFHNEQEAADAVIKGYQKRLELTIPPEANK